MTRPTVGHHGQQLVAFAQTANQRRMSWPTAKGSQNLPPDLADAIKGPDLPPSPVVCSRVTNTGRQNYPMIRDLKAAQICAGTCPPAMR